MRILVWLKLSRFTGMNSSHAMRHPEVSETSRLRNGLCMYYNAQTVVTSVGIVAARRKP